MDREFGMDSRENKGRQKMPVTGAKAAICCKTADFVHIL